MGMALETRKVATMHWHHSAEAQEEEEKIATS